MPASAIGASPPRPSGWAPNSWSTATPWRSSCTRSSAQSSQSPASRRRPAAAERPASSSWSVGGAAPELVHQVARRACDCRRRRGAERAGIELVAGWRRRARARVRRRSAGLVTAADHRARRRAWHRHACSRAAAANGGAMVTAADVELDHAGELGIGASASSVHGSSLLSCSRLSSALAQRFPSHASRGIGSTVELGRLSSTTST